jgi:hypothetical protein
MAATSRFDSYLKYELEHPIAKSLPSGTFIPPYLVGEIYTMKEELEEAINDIYSVVHETILDYQEAAEDEDAAELLAKLEMVKQFVEKALKEL